MRAKVHINHNSLWLYSEQELTNIFTIQGHFDLIISLRLQDKDLIQKILGVFRSGPASPQKIWDNMSNLALEVLQSQIFKVAVNQT